MNFYIGIDFGTSGARLILINAQCEVYFEIEQGFTAPSSDTDWPKIWKITLWNLIKKIPLKLRSQVSRIAINGTSATVLLCNPAGIPVDAPIFYNDGRGGEVLEGVKAIAPANHPVQSATSSLAKLFWWQQQITRGNTPQKTTLNHSISQPLYFLHQADWLGFLLHGKLGITDYHNALKLGYDVADFCYPKWLTNQQSFHPETRFQLPTVVAPGTALGAVTADISAQLSLPEDCRVCAGTTDSIAAFLASGATSPGEAVTSLGSTLVIKLLSRTQVDQSQYGIYSHRLGDLWLTGGASNTGGAVLRHYFNDEQLRDFSQQIDPTQTIPLDYYPLLKPGDRFPINDPNLAPRLEPRPDNDVEFLHGLLESMARIEAQGYQRLQQFGATTLNRVYTAGGGAKNTVWTQIRQRHLQVSLTKPVHTAAAYGTALLALRGISGGILEEM